MAYFMNFDTICGRFDGLRQTILFWIFNIFYGLGYYLCIFTSFLDLDTICDRLHGQKYNVFFGQKNYLLHILYLLLNVYGMNFNTICDRFDRHKILFMADFMNKDTICSICIHFYWKTRTAYKSTTGKRVCKCMFFQKE